MRHKRFTLAAALLAATISATAMAAPDSAPPELLDEAKAFDATAARDQELARRQLAGTFGGLAGGETNAGRLVHALRTGETVELEPTSSADTAASFDPATGQMGWGNVFISLALAKESLAQAGITEPTTAQLDAALNGGTITIGGQDVMFAGVLAQRADGQGWGQIAQAMGVKLGRVVSAIRSENKSLGAAAGARPARAADDGRKVKTDQRDRGARAGGRGEGPERSQRPARIDRPDRPVRPDMANRAGGRDR